MDTNIYALIKYGQKDRLLQLLETGKLYLSTLEALRAKGDKKADNHQIDHLEGAERYFSKGPIEVTMTPNPNGKPIKVMAQNLTYEVKNTLISGNVACFYSITDECFTNRIYTPIDRKMAGFGTHALLITNVDEFLKRIHKAVPDDTWSSLHYGHVEYFDERDFADNLHIFQKRSSYSYQREFRVFIQSNQFKPVSIDLGPLKDIARLLPAEATFHIDLKPDPATQSVELKLKASNLIKF